MNKKLIPIIITIAIILLGLGVYLFFTLNPARREGLQNTVGNLFPFGQTGDQEPTAPGGSVTLLPPIEGGETIIETNVPVFRQVSSIPANSYRAIVTEELQSLPRTTVLSNGETETVYELRPIKKYSIRFASIENGAIHESIINDQITTQQITDAGVPSITHALFGLNGTSLVSQYADGALGNEVVHTFFSKISKVPLVVPACPFDFPVNIKFQDQSDAVANVQRFLNGYLGIIISETGENSPGNETGIFDELTREAIKKFQTANNLTADGSVGPKTRETFNAACMVVQTKKAEELYQQNNDFFYRTSGSFGADNIIDIKNFDAQNFVYLVKNGAKAFAIIFNPETRTARQVFDSSFTEWLIEPVAGQKIIFTTKASGQTRGFAYELDITKNTFTRIIGDRTGLTTLTSPDGATVLFGTTIQNGYQIALLNRTSNTTSSINLETLPEKCVWSNDSIMLYCAVPDSLPNGIYPDVLYQGLITTTDTLWSINTVTGATQKLYDPKQDVNSGMMVGDLQITNDGRYLFMKNHNDDTIWILSLFQ